MVTQKDINAQIKLGYSIRKEKGSKTLYCPTISFIEDVDDMNCTELIFDCRLASPNKQDVLDIINIMETCFFNKEAFEKVVKTQEELS